MAVYTKITTSQLQQHLKNYELGELLKITEIVDGIDNSNFLRHAHNWLFCENENHFHF